MMFGNKQRKNTLDSLAEVCFFMSLCGVAPIKDDSLPSDALRLLACQKHGIIRNFLDGKQSLLRHKRKNDLFKYRVVRDISSFR